MSNDIHAAFEKWIEDSGADYDPTRGADGDFNDHNAADAFQGFEANWHVIESLKKEVASGQKNYRYVMMEKDRKIERLQAERKLYREHIHKDTDSMGRAAGHLLRAHDELKGAIETPLIPEAGPESEECDE